MEFTMMEKSVKGEFSAAGRSFPPYGTGNNHNTWYAATMVDARGVEIPYLDRDGNVLKTVSERYYLVRGQKFFLKGGDMGGMGGGPGGSGGQGGPGGGQGGPGGGGGGRP